MQLIQFILVLDLVSAQGKSPWEFSGWSAFKPGSTVKLKVEADLAGLKQESYAIGTLVENQAAHVIVETVAVEKGAEQPPRKLNLKKAAEVEKRWAAEGDEELDIGGKKVKCRWGEVKVGDNEVKVWMSNEIPGGIAKVSTRDTRAKISVLMQAESWESK